MQSVKNLTVRRAGWWHGGRDAQTGGTGVGSVGVGVWGRGVLRQAGESKGSERD